MSQKELGFETLERGTRAPKIHARVISPEMLGKIFCYLYVRYGDGRILVHRSTILDLMHHCIGVDVPPLLHETLNEALLRERMVGGIVRAGLASHVDGGVRGELCIRVSGIEASFLLGHFAIDFPEEAKWLLEHVAPRIPERCR